MSELTDQIKAVIFEAKDRGDESAALDEILLLLDAAKEGA